MNEKQKKSDYTYLQFAAWDEVSISEVWKKSAVFLKIKCQICKQQKLLYHVFMNINPSVQGDFLFIENLRSCCKLGYTAVLFTVGNISLILGYFEILG